MENGLQGYAACATKLLNRFMVSKHLTDQSKEGLVGPTDEQQFRQI
jgi:hypothetical protein